MSMPIRYDNIYIPVKYFLFSYRAFSDGQCAVRSLEERLNKEDIILLTDWKIIWLGACTLLRTAIDLLKLDGKSCINEKIREELVNEWQSIKNNRSDHKIFWDFLRYERNNIIHEYNWSAYEAWLQQDGTITPAQITLLSFKRDDARLVLAMRGGPYNKRNALELIKESGQWVESRILGAIRRAEFDPDEKRNVITFEKRPKNEHVQLRAKTVLEK